MRASVEGGSGTDVRLRQVFEPLRAFDAVALGELLGRQPGPLQTAPSARAAVRRKGLRPLPEVAGEAPLAAELPGRGEDDRLGDAPISEGLRLPNEGAAPFADVENPTGS